MAADLSIIVPVYNEEESLAEFYLRLSAQLDSLKEQSEMVFINDGSRDRTEEILSEFHRHDRRVKVINLSRNFGHQVAITAGMDFVQCQACIIIDADLQDPPEIIPDMVKLWRSGFEVVYAVRAERRGESRFKLWTAAFFYQLLKWLSRIDIPQNSGDFRLLDRKVIDSLKKLPERNRFVRGLVSWVGFRQTQLTYERDPRVSGVTKYPFFKMLKFALDGITSFSDVPLRLATWMGLFFSAISFLMLCWVLWTKLQSDRTVLGWASIMVAVLFTGGIQLFTVGILGEYIGRIFDEAKQRPLYLVRSTQGLE